VESIEFSGNAFLVIPNIGVKYTFSDKEIQPYAFGSLFIGLPMVNIEGKGNYETWENGELTETESNVEIPDLSTLEETVADILGFWGVSLGGGAEYFFHPQFSIGAEYGFKLVFDSATVNRETTNMDEQSMSGYQKTWNADVSASMRMSYAAMTLNFYF
ncbi:hypothetical protein ACFL4L_07320, partial [bacterium]